MKAETEQKTIDRWYVYTATGVLEKTEPNQTPTQFVVNGKVNEKWFTNGKIGTKKGKSALVPENIERQSNFLNTIPLGTKVIFKESAYRSDKLYKHSFYIKVVGQKKSKRKNRLTRKQKNYSRAGEKKLQRL